MEGCKWRLKINNGQYLEFNSEDELNTFIAENQSKYDWNGSPEYIKISTENYVDNIIRTNRKSFSEDISNIKAIKSKNVITNEDLLEEGDSDTISVTDLIVKPDKDGNRLVPEVIEENYISDLYKNSIIDFLWNKLNINSFLFPTGSSNEFIRDQLSEKWFGTQVLNSSNYKSFLENIIKNYQSSFRETVNPTNAEIKNVRTVVENEIRANVRAQLNGEYVDNIYYNLVDRGLSAEEVKKNFHRITAYIKSKFEKQYEDQDTLVKEEIAKMFTENNEHYISWSLFDQHVTELDKTLQEIRKNHSGKDGKLRGGVKMYSQVDLTTELGYSLEGKTKLRGKIDLLVIDGDSVVIYDFKFSKKPYNSWADEKHRTAKYQLAFYGRMLNQLGINTNNIQYYIAPFYKNGQKHLVSDGLKNITNDVNSPYTMGKVDDFIPMVTYTQYSDPSAMEKIDKIVEKVIPEEYITSKTFRVNQKVIFEKNAKKVTKRGKEVWRFYNEIDGKYEEFETKEEVENRIEQYVEQLKEMRPLIIDKTVNDLKNIIKGITKSQDLASEGNKRGKEFFKLMFDKYYDQSKYAVVEDENLLKRGIILITSSEGSLDIITLDELDLNDFVYWSESSKMKSIFELLAKPGSELEKRIENAYSVAKLIPIEANRGTVSLLKALIILNESPQYSHLKIGEIRAINRFTNQSKSFNNSEISFIENILSETLTHEDGTPFERNLTTITSGALKGQNRLTTVVDKAFEHVLAIMRTDLSPDSQLRKILQNSELFISDRLPESDRESIIKKLTVLLNDIRNSEHLNESELQIHQTGAQVYAWIAMMLNYYEGINMFEENPPAKLFGKDFPNWLDSMMINSLDTIRSQNIVNLRNVMSRVFQKVRNEYTNFLQELRKKQEVWEKHIDYGILNDRLIGAKGGMDKVLYREGEYDLIFKDPWDMSNDLDETARDRIKFALYTITGKTKREDLDENDFRVPLLRARLASNFSNGTGSAKVIYDRFAYDFKAAIKDTFEERAGEQQKAADSMNQAVFEFEDRKNVEKRNKLIQKYGVEAFETNLELILATYKMAQLKNNALNDALPQLRAIQAVLTLQGSLTGNDMKQVLDFVTKAIKSSLYEESLVPNEMKSVYRTLSAMRNVASTVALSWNFINLPREVLMGIWTNLSSAMFKRYGKEAFNIKDYGQALKYLVYDSPKFIKEVTKIELLNELYAMANMDLRNMVENTVSYKNGIVGGFSRYSGWALTAPDYFNRMSIFIAQMVHDGCFLAHTVVEDKNGTERLRYDITKDERFDVYFKYKDKKQVPNNVKAIYEKQYGLYLAMLKQFNEERVSMGLPEYKIGDKFDTAYTILQRESIKSFADESFGYYDLETKAMFNKLWQGMLFKQFMVYLSAKKTQYLLKRTTIASQGHFNAVTGLKGQQKYIKIIVDQNGNWVDSELTDEDTGIPLYAWEGRVMEGILQTYTQLCKDIYRNIKNMVTDSDATTNTDLWKKYIWSDGIEAANFKASLYDLFMFLLFGKLLQMALLDNPDESGISYKQQIADSGWWKRNGIDIVNRSLDDMGIINALNAGIWNWEPPMFSILANAVKSFNSAFKLEDVNFAESLLLGTVNTAGLMRPWRVDINNAVKNK